MATWWWRDDLRRKKKMYELMPSAAMYVLELPQKQADAEAFEYWVRELAEFRAFLSAASARNQRRESAGSDPPGQSRAGPAAAIGRADEGRPAASRRSPGARPEVQHLAMPAALQQYERVLRGR